MGSLPVLLMRYGLMGARSIEAIPRASGYVVMAISLSLNFPWPPTPIINRCVARVAAT